MTPIAPHHLVVGDTCPVKPVSSSSSMISSSVSVSVSSCTKDSTPCMPSRTKNNKQQQQPEQDSSFKFEFEFEDDEQPAAARHGFHRGKECAACVLSALQEATDINEETTSGPCSFWNSSSSSLSLENLLDEDNDKFHTGAAAPRLAFPTSSCHSNASEEYSLSGELLAAPNNNNNNNSRQHSTNNISENSLSEMPNLESFCHGSYTFLSQSSSMNFVDSTASFSSFSSPDALASGSVADLQQFQVVVEDTTTTTTTTTSTSSMSARPSKNSPKSCLKASSTSSILYGPRAARRDTRWSNGKSSTSSDSLPSLKGR
jgi:hypothetical protein